MNPIRKTKATKKSRGRSRPENSTPIFLFQDSDGLGGFGLATVSKLVTVPLTEARLGEVSFADCSSQPWHAAVSVSNLTLQL